MLAFPKYRMQTNVAKVAVEEQLKQPTKKKSPNLMGEHHDFRIPTTLARDYMELGQMGTTSKQLFGSIIKVLKKYPDIIEEIKKENRK